MCNRGEDEGLGFLPSHRSKGNHQTPPEMEGSPRPPLALRLPAHNNLSPYPLSPDDCQELLNGWLRLLRSGLCGGLWVDLGLTAEPPNKAQAKAQGPHLLDTGSLSPQHHTGLKNLINLARRLFPSVVLG